MSLSSPKVRSADSKRWLKCPCAPPHRRSDFPERAQDDECLMLENNYCMSIISAVIYSSTIDLLKHQIAAVIDALVAIFLHVFMLWLVWIKCWKQLWKPMLLAHYPWQQLYASLISEVPVVWRCLSYAAEAKSKIQFSNRPSPVSIADQAFWMPVLLKML